MSSDPSWSLVNWIHLDNSEALTIQRLGVRYRLHPLVVEDLVYRENRGKIDKYKTHMLLTLPFIHYQQYSDYDYKAFYSNYTVVKKSKNKIIPSDIDNSITFYSK